MQRKNRMVRLLLLMLLCFLATNALAQHQRNSQYLDMRRSKLIKKANEGDVLAKYWVAHRSNSFEEKAKWFEQYAKQRKTSHAVQYLGKLHDEYEDNEKAYFWFLVTLRFCKKEEYTDKWCADAKKRVSSIEPALPEGKVAELKRKAKVWGRKKSR